MQEMMPPFGMKVRHLRMRAAFFYSLHLSTLHKVPQEHNKPPSSGGQCAHASDGAAPGMKERPLEIKTVPVDALRLPILT